MRTAVSGCFLRSALSCSARTDGWFVWLMQLTGVILVLALAAGIAAFGQSPPVAPADPHEDPRLNGAAPPVAPSARPDPNAVPNPVPVRPPNPNAPATENSEQTHTAPSDSEIMRKIRKLLSDDKSTSRYARRLTVISHAGAVTLKGQAPTAEVRRRIEQKATNVAGVGKVTNEIRIQPAKLRDRVSQ